MGRGEQSCIQPGEMPVTPIKTEGYAYVADGSIRVETVSGTEIAAIVNAIVAVFKKPIRYGLTDEEIKAAWRNISEGKGVVVKVYISTKPD